jgi:DNA-directed RNA polymerase subunit RPC12/RpoP
MAAATTPPAATPITPLAAPEPRTAGVPFTGAGMVGGGGGVALMTAPVAAPVGSEWITCPECGLRAAIDPTQRRADDFCRRCDYPLFWARAAVVPLSGEETGASLRRLPGTVGRAATASVACPHCNEPNSPTALICIRCGRSMLPDPEPEPEPEPVYVAPPPLPEPEPEKGFPLWWVVVMCVCLLIITILVAWVALS